MKTLIAITILVLSGISTPAQENQPGRQQRLNSIVRSNPQPPGEPQSKNLQLELTIARGGKTARYLMTFNGGQIQTDLIDKLADPSTNAEPKFISFSATCTPFEDNGGELAVFIGRTINYRAGSRTENGAQRDIIQSKTLGHTTKVALRPNKPVLLFDDQDEKITLKLTEL